MKKTANELEHEWIMGLGFRRDMTNIQPDGSWTPATGVAHPAGTTYVFTRTEDGTFATSKDAHWTALFKNISLEQPFTELPVAAQNAA